MSCAARVHRAWKQLSHDLFFLAQSRQALAGAANRGKPLRQYRSVSCQCWIVRVLGCSPQTICRQCNVRHPSASLQTTRVTNAGIENLAGWLWLWLCTPSFLLALYEGHADALHLLLGAKADPDKARENGTTPTGFLPRLPRRHGLPAQTFPGSRCHPESHVKDKISSSYHHYIIRAVQDSLQRNYVAVPTNVELVVRLH